MKFSTPFRILVLAIILSSCSPEMYYQVLKTKPDDGMVIRDNSLIFEDENCIISYNLWSNGGNIGFTIYNKTDRDLYINLDKCFFVYNGKAKKYYQNRTFSKSEFSIISSSETNSESENFIENTYYKGKKTKSSKNSNKLNYSENSGNTISFTEEKLKSIPPKTFININEYFIITEPIRDCNLLRYPKLADIHNLSFNEQNSPLNFSNLITYSMENSDSIFRVSNAFYISEISNYSEREIITLTNNEICDEKDIVTVVGLKYFSPNSFFLPYLMDGYSRDSNKLNLKNLFSKAKRSVSGLGGKSENKRRHSRQAED